MASTSNFALLRPDTDALRARDPETSMEDLSDLLGDHPDDFLMNPVLPLLPVLGATFLAQPTVGAINRLFLCPTLPRYLIVLLHEVRRKDNLALPARLVTHPRTPLHLLFERLISWDPMQLRHAQSSPLLAALISALLRRASSVEAFRLLPRAALQETFDALLLDLVVHDDPEFRAYAAAHERTPPGWLERLASDPHPSVRQAAVTNPKLPVEPRLRAARGQDPAVLVALARDPESPPEVFEALAAGSRVLVRFLVAEQPRAPLPVLEALASDPSPLVRRALSWNASLPAMTGR